MNNKVLYRGAKGAPPTLNVFANLQTRINYTAGTFGGVVRNIGGYSSGTGSLDFPSLAGISIISCEGTGVPYKDTNSIIFPLGVYWDLLLSDGTYIPDITSGYDVSGMSNHATVINITSDYSQTGTTYFTDNGFNVVGNTYIPASQTTPSLDVFGNNIKYISIPKGLNLCGTIIRFTDSSMNKNAVVGNLIGLDEVWLSPTTWDYYDASNPSDWKVEELNITYINNRLSTEFLYTIFVREVRNTLGDLLGIDRLDIMSTPLSSEDALKLNEVYAGGIYNVAPTNISQVRSGLVEDVIMDGVVDRAPSQNAVFDAINNNSIYKFKVEYFTESTTQNIGEQHQIEYVPKTSTSIRVSVNGKELNFSEFSLVANSVQVLVPVYQYDDIVIAYQGIGTSSWCYKMESFVETADGVVGQINTLAYNIASIDTVLVSLNGNELKPPQYILGINTVQLTIPVYQYDEITITYNHY